MTRNFTKFGTYAPKQWSAKDGTLTTANCPSVRMMTICAVTLTRIRYATPNRVALLTPIIMIINLSIEEHMALTRLLSHPKTMKYRSDLFDTDTFDSMEDKVFDAVNNLTVEDF